jgi:hypothetical protein
VEDDVVYQRWGTANKQGEKQGTQLIRRPMKGYRFQFQLFFVILMEMWYSWHF